MMPATGVRPPLLMLVMVRAMAPVAGIPPKMERGCWRYPVLQVPGWSRGGRRDAVGHGGRKQRLYGTQYGNGDGRRYKLLDGRPVQVGHIHARQFCFDGETVA